MRGKMGEVTILLRLHAGRRKRTGQQQDTRYRRRVGMRDSESMG